MKKRPIRLRSKICILVYPKQLSALGLKNHLEENFGIKAKNKAENLKKDKKWKYFIKSENCNGNKMIVTVFLEFRENPDLYSDKLSIEVGKELIKPLVWGFQERSYPLHSILKFQTSFNIETDVLTNFSLREIEDYITILEEPKINNSATKSKRKKKEKKIKHVSKNPFRNKHLNEIKEAEKELDKLLTHTIFDEPSARKVLNTIVNKKYYYSETITHEALDIIESCNRKYRIRLKRI